MKTIRLIDHEKTWKCANGSVWLSALGCMNKADFGRRRRNKK